MWRTVIEKGLSWLDVMCHPDGEISFFNDAALENAQKGKDIEGYEALIGIVPSAVELEGISTFKSSGYSRLQLDQCFVIFYHTSIGLTYLPWHAKVGF